MISEACKEKLKEKLKQNAALRDGKKFIFRVSLFRFVFKFNFTFGVKQPKK